MAGHTVQRHMFFRTVALHSFFEKNQPHSRHNGFLSHHPKSDKIPTKFEQLWELMAGVAGHHGRTVATVAGQCPDSVSNSGFWNNNTKNKFLHSQTLSQVVLTCL